MADQLNSRNKSIQIIADTILPPNQWNCTRDVRKNYDMKKKLK